MSPPVADDDNALAGNEPWNVDHTVALARPWYGVSATPLGNGAGNRKGDFWVHLKANSGYTYAFRRIVGIRLSGCNVNVLKFSA